MKIEHAFTYKYETNHFGVMLDHVGIKEGRCFENVTSFCETYRKRGRNVSVSLVIGLRSWENSSCTSGYHYLVRDDETGEFSDPQYSRYTFIEIHNWSLEDYKKDCEEFVEECGIEQSSEFFQWYCENGFSKTFKKGLQFIKAIASYRVRLSDKDIKEDCATGIVYAKPKYGTKVIQYLNVG